MSQTTTRRRNRRITPQTRGIAQILQEALPNARVDVYRYDPYSIRIRIIDEAFAGKTRVARERPVLRILRQLPEETQQDLTMLILLAPKEVKNSPVNLEFEDPTPSVL